jgi:two-component system LytT family response regulator
MQISAVIIDDEQNNIDNLRELLRTYCPVVQVIACANNVTDGRKAIQENAPDIVFLDIQMPDASGFDLLKQLPHKNFEVIFVTAYDKYAIQAIRFSAIDYLLKPINVNELQHAVEKAIRTCEAKAQNHKLENLIHLLKWQQNKEEHRIALVTMKETRFVKPGEIVRCESSNTYCTFYLNDGAQLLVSRPIFQFEEILKEYGFIRCHQSHLVNKNFIKSWVKEDGDYLLLFNGMQVPISRHKKEMIKQTLRIP